MRKGISDACTHIHFFSDSFPIFSFSSCINFWLCWVLVLSSPRLSSCSEWEVLLLDGFSLRSMTSRAPGFWWAVASGCCCYGMWVFLDQDQTPRPLHWQGPSEKPQLLLIIIVILQLWKIYTRKKMEEKVSACIFAGMRLLGDFTFFFSHFPQIVSKIYCLNILQQGCISFIILRG